MSSALPTRHREVTDDLLAFIAEAITPWHAVEAMRRRLEAAGFRPLAEAETIAAGDCLYDTAYGASLIACVVGDEQPLPRWHIVGAHSDSPALRVKPAAERDAEGVRRLATEVYGGPILNSWFDRPLGLAGRVSLRGREPMACETRLVDLTELRLILPSLAIHMNREVNDGVRIDAQRDLLPLLGLADDPRSLSALLAAELELDEEAIGHWDLLLYDPEPGQYLGHDEPWFIAPRLDNLASCHAGLLALLAAAERARAGEPPAASAVLHCADHEEVGSQSAEGARSPLLRDRLERIALGRGATRADFLESLDRSFLISCDLAHGVHPNRGEMADAGTRPRLGGGPVVKLAANRSYISDGEATAIFEGLCRAADVPCQFFANRSDLRGGSTIGPLSAGHLPLRGIDIGMAIWGMHSLRETGGSEDPGMMFGALREFLCTHRV